VGKILTNVAIPQADIAKMTKAVIAPQKNAKNNSRVKII
jgi:hypothetical protein